MARGDEMTLATGINLKPHPYADVLRALADGKTIQYSEVDGVWRDVNLLDKQMYKPPLFHLALGTKNHNKFRIKPEPKRLWGLWHSIEKKFNGGSHAYTYSDEDKAARFSRYQKEDGWEWVLLKEYIE